MSSNTENIEARLCAYVEGDLDEQGLAEIEKHLETHPAHRALLDELKRTKSMLMALPREQAPADLSETLQGHLERSVLLDGVGTNEIDTTLKINRWPQIFGVAAVVLLALGLGVLVYVVLPQHSSAPVAIQSTKDGLVHTPGMPDTSTSDDAAGFTDRSAKTANGELDKELGKFGSKPTDVVATPPLAAAPGAGEQSDLNKTAGLTLTESPKDSNPIVAAVEAGGRRFGKGGFAPDNTTAVSAPAADNLRRVYVVVSTDNIETTNGQLANYLATNKIAWQPMNRGVLEVQSPADVALASRANTQQFGLNGNGNSNTDNNTYAAKKSADSYNQYTQLANQNYASKGAPAEPTQNGTINSNGADNRSQLAGNLSQTVVPAGMNGIAQQQVQATQNADAAPGQQLAAGGGGAAQQHSVPAAVLPTYDLAGSKSESVIVAKGLTRQQAVELGQSLDKLYAGQTSVVVDHDAADTVDAALAKERKQLQAKVMDDAKAPAATQPSTTQPAASDAAAVGVAATPTTVPAGEDLADALNAPPHREAAAELTLQPGPSTQPADTQTQIAQADLSLKPRPAAPQVEEPVDVVIVVQPAMPNKAPAANATSATGPVPNAAPSTQPAPAEMAHDAPPVGDAVPATQPAEPAMGK